MQLRRWCVSKTYDPIRYFWTMEGADQHYWQSSREARDLKLIGLYRWNGHEWIKQVCSPRMVSGPGCIWVDE